MEQKPTPKICDREGQAIGVGSLLTLARCHPVVPLVEVVEIYSDGAFKIRWLDGQHNDYIIDPGVVRRTQWVRFAGVK